MLTRRYFVTLRRPKKGPPAVGLSPEPGLDREWIEKTAYSGVAVWNRPFPLWLAEDLQQELSRLLATTGDFSLTGLGRKLSARAKYWGWPETGRWVDIPRREEILAGVFHHQDLFSRLLPAVLPGRFLTLREIASALSRAGLEVTDGVLEFLLHMEVLNGRVERLAGVGLDETGRFFCRRCGERERIGEEFSPEPPFTCRVCQSCLALGPVTGLQPLYRWRGSLPPRAAAGAPLLTLPELTPWQMATARQVLAFWEGNGPRVFLIWAVCGAGKTEVVFLTIRRALAEGKRVLLTVPRREIAKELGERVKKCFPGLTFTLLHGGQKEEHPGDGLVVATTHQLLRFAPFFHLVILDEADAYPYRGNRMLINALFNTLLPEGKLIYMTATPDEEWRKKAVRGEIGLSRLVLRHHGFPLPVPALVQTALPPEENKNWQVPAPVLSFLHKAKGEKRQVLIFLPTVRLTEKAGRALQDVEEGLAVDYIHSRDPGKDRKLKAFEAGRLHVLVTTTLLERGLTFPRLDVLVLYADREGIFSTETLVQIAGRVGRSILDPSGEVLFVGEKISAPMQNARLWIEDMNKEAKKLGFLK